MSIISIRTSLCRSSIISTLQKYADTRQIKTILSDDDLFLCVEHHKLKVCVHDYLLVFNFPSRHFDVFKPYILDSIYIFRKKDNLPLFAAKDLFKKYHGSNFFSLKNVNLAFNSGEIIGLLGHNGAGKSTFLKTVVGQETATHGSLHIMGMSSDSNLAFYKSFFGYIPDHYILFDDFTGREYVNYVADLYHVNTETRRRLVSRYLRIFHLADSFDARISTYSFGMKQKLTIIATLVHEPKILLLDEPLTGLDPESIAQIKKCFVEEAKKGNLIIFSSHLIDVVEELATRLVVLKKGEVIYDEQKIKAMKKYHNDLNKMYLEKVGNC